MKTKILSLCVCMLLSVISINAKINDKKKETVTFLVSMTCGKCQQRIESNIPYEKGVTDLKVDLSKKLVTIEYRSDKTNAQNIKAALTKMGFTATPFNGLQKGKMNQGEKKSCCKDKKGQDEKKSCCKGKMNQGEKKSCCKDKKGHGEKKSCCKDKK